jgi:hypothetical protein
VNIRVRGMEKTAHGGTSHIVLFIIVLSRVTKLRIIT